MFQNNSRINISNAGIEFYEQDILHDDYIYKGDFDIALNLKYVTPGFGIGLVNSEGTNLSDKEKVILFKIGYKNVDIISKINNVQKTISTYSSAFAVTGEDTLPLILKKRGQLFTLYVGEQKICEMIIPIEFKTYNMFYYSNKENVIQSINISSAIPYGWATNMQNTNGGYIIFHKDAFELKGCNGNAEIEQSDIPLTPGKYYLKFDISEDSDISPYIFPSDSDIIIDKAKNMLTYAYSFDIEYFQKVCLKFVGTKGKIKNISITSDRDNHYIRTSPEEGSIVDIEGSMINVNLEDIKLFSLDFVVDGVPGNEHIEPSEYYIISSESNLGIIPLNIAIGVPYKLEYDGDLSEINVVLGERLMATVKVNDKYLKMFKNVNSVISNFKITNINDESFNVGVGNTVKKYVPSTIFSPIIVIDNNNIPLDLSSSYRIVEGNDSKYLFTNVEREYFEPNTLIKLTNAPSNKEGNVIVYGIKKGAQYDLSNILKIKERGRDTIELFANYYDIIFEKDLRSIDRERKEIRLDSIDEYELIVVDYLKNNSYSINYRHEFNSYEVDISVDDDIETEILYNNAFESDTGISYINEFRYVNTNTVPSENCYIALGG